MVIIGCIMLLAGLAGYLLPEPSEAVPPRMLMDNAGGRVVFTHKAHSTPGGTYGDSACVACHHELNIAPDSIRNAATPDVLGCKACHGTADDPAFVEKHHQMYYNGKNGEESCMRCHHMRFDGYSSLWNHEDHKDLVGDCATCHHPAKFEYKPGKVMNIKPQKCSNCHGLVSNPMTDKTLKVASHMRCESCHTEFFEEGTKGCVKCHNAVPAAESAKAKAGSADAKLDKAYITACSSCHNPLSGGMDAYHGKCIGCHAKMQRGPAEKACNQCHTP